MAEKQSNISANPKIASVGLVLDSVIAQMPQGTLSWAVNAVIESFDGHQVTYSNEQANTACTSWPSGYRPIGLRNIVEEGIILAWLLSPSTGDCQIGIVKNCIYTTVINAKCLNFSVDNPIIKHAHRNTNCGLEIYWVDGRNNARFIQLEKLPFMQQNDPASCGFIITSEVDCNKLNLQPNFSIPTIEILGTNAGGDLIEGKYYFAVEYANALGDAYTSYYGITEGVPIFDGTQATQNFNNPVSRNISLRISDIDQTGVFEYINVAVIKVINNTSSVDLVGTFQITEPIRDIVYSGNGTPIERDIQDIFQRYVLPSKPNDLTVALDVLILADLSLEDRISYQSIANKIDIGWATVRLDGRHHPYAVPTNVVKYEGYMRDEIYPVEVSFELTNGYITDGFHIPGRKARASDVIPVLNDDVETNISTVCDDQSVAQPYWKVYNTGTVTKPAPVTADDCYEGAWEEGEMAYWESTEEYPCNSFYGELEGQKIRHPKFPDCSVTHIHDNHGFIYPIGIQIDVQQIVNLIKTSTILTQEQKENIQAIRIMRGNRGKANQSISGKGLITNVLKAATQGNKIDATTGAPSDSNDNANSNVLGILNNAYDYTHKGHIDANKYAFLFFPRTLLIGKNAEINARYNRAENLINAVRHNPDLYTETNLTLLHQASDKLQEIVDTSGGDAKGKSQSQAAKALIDGAISIIEAQIELNNSLASIDTSEVISDDSTKYEYFPNFLFNDVRIAADGTPADFFLDNTIIDDDAHLRYALHSPDMSFYQPSLGSQMKIETVEMGTSSGHIVETKNHSKYQFISTIGYITALLAGVTVGFGSGSYGIGSVNVFNGEAMFTAYQAFLDILYKTVPRKNFAHQFNAVGSYSDFKKVGNEGNKQRVVDIATYLSPGRLNADDKYTVNNYQRESSVYLRTTKPLPFTDTISGVPKDASKLAGATFDVINTPISSYYASLKKNIPNQWGQLYSYETLDTGYMKKISLHENNYVKETVFGGDTYINKFAYKSKMPFFIDNRINPYNSVIWPDGSDISYNELSNVGRVKYWFSTDVTANTSFFDSFFSTMTQHFFWPKISTLYLSGMVFLFAYGIPSFFCESAVNVDLRKAYNNTEGDFYPRVSSGIPDDWLQESYVPIANDNSYWYNKSFSKQNDFTAFTHLPPDYDFAQCRVEFPFRAVFSDPMTDNPNPSNRNNWRIFRPAARFDFPQNYGKLISLDGIETRQVLARFENKTLLYNALLTAPTSVGGVYLGSPLFSRNVPPIDYAETDVGYIGSQHKFILKTEYGHVVADAKRGEIFLLQGQKATPLSDAGVDKFLTEFLGFQLNKAFPEYNIDNNFNGVGLHGVYDTKYKRLIITKLDYKPIVSNILLKNGSFEWNNTQIELTDTRYFCNYSFTISYSFKTNTWVSLHTYLPEYYVPEADYFYSGNLSSLWQHNTSINKFNNFYGSIHPYILEYPYAYSFNDEILQNIQDYSKVLQYNDFRELIETNNYYFNKFIGWSNQQSTGLTELVMSPKNNMFLKKQYPKYNLDSKSVLVSKSDSFYNINTFWDMIKDTKKSVWLKSCTSLSEYKVLNQDNHDYTKRSFKKAPLRGKELHLRFILDDRDDIKIISGFTVAPTAASFK